MLTKYGQLFRVPDIAEESYEEMFCLDLDPADYRTAWALFMDIIGRHEKLQDAFGNAWPKSGVVPFFIGKGYPLDAAEVISQETALSAWRNFLTFMPWLSAWNTWILTIARRRAVDYLRHNVERQVQTAPLELIVIGKNDQRVARISEDGWSVPTICMKWIESGSPARSAIAWSVLRAYYDQDWEPIGSLKMQSEIGLSEQACINLFRQFAKEVQEYEGYDGFWQNRPQRKG